MRHYSSVFPDMLKQPIPSGDKRGGGAVGFDCSLKLGCCLGVADYYYIKGRFWRVIVVNVGGNSCLIGRLL